MWCIRQSDLLCTRPGEIRWAGFAFPPLRFNRAVLTRGEGGLIGHFSMILRNPLRNMDFLCTEFWFGLMLGALVGQVAFISIWLGL
jgi:hypothetical protein